MTSRSPIPILSALRRTPLPIILACTPWLVILAWLTAISWFQATDDAFISFRYARNLIEGHGLVFNIGERVEGYSNFLWTIELAAIWRALGIPPEDAAPWLSTAFTVATIATMIWWAARLPYLQHRNLVIWMSLGLVCTSATFAVWTSAGGLETRQFTFFIVLAVVLLTTYRNSRPGLLAASASLAMASLTRPEGSLIAASCFAWYALQCIAAPSVNPVSGGSEPRGSLPPALARIRSLAARIPGRELLCLIAPFAVIAGAHLLFRFTYYGEWLPNTYYAKYTGPWYDMGILYLTAAALDTGLYLLLPLAGVGIWSRWRAHRGDLVFALPLMCIMPHMHYLMQIGGDVFEYRPLDFYWPLLAVPAAAGIVWLGGATASRARRSRAFAWGKGVVASSTAWALLLFVPIVIYANAIQGTLLYRGATVPGSILISDPEFDVRSVGWLLAVPGVHALVGASNALHISLFSHNIARPASWFRRYDNILREKMGPYWRAVGGILPDDTVTHEGTLGFFSYYLPSVTIVDNHGLTDKAVARSTFTAIVRTMAHERIPPPGYLEERGVNITIYPPQTNAANALDRASYAVQVGTNLWMPFDTHDHQWAHSNFAQHGLRTRRIDLDALVGDHNPIIDSRYDVYLIENDLIYVNTQCDSHYDLAATFFLHLFPADPRDLPPERTEYGFQNWGFTFQTGEGTSVDGICVTTRRLPEHEIAAIRTGQYLYGYASEDTQFWEAEFHFDEQNK